MVLMTDPALTPTPGVLALLSEANHRLVRTVDRLTAEQLAEASLLPGWSRAHVVAHLALNAEGLERALRGLAGRPGTTMYDSDESRDTDIADLADAPASELRARLLAATECFDRAVESMPVTQWTSRIERTPGGQTFTARMVPSMRLREVEIHHVDLDAGYSCTDWPAEFAALVLETLTHRSYPEPFRVLARDLAQTWDYGAVAATTAVNSNVSGESHQLAWWLTGRGDGSALTVDQDQLPEVPAW